MKLEKVTDIRSRRWYDDACGTALAMELVGERWSLLVVRELMFGPRRFGELKANLAGISANVLTQRLDGLARAGVVARRKLPPPASVQVYELTAWGYESEAAIRELGRWAARSPAHDPTLPLSAASLMLSFRTMFSQARAGFSQAQAGFSQEKAGGWRATIGFQFGAEGFVGVVDDDWIHIRRDESAGADVVFDSDPMTMASLVYGGRPFADAEDAGVLRITGNRALAERFVTLFPLPAKVAVE